MASYWQRSSLSSHLALALLLPTAAQGSAIKRFSGEARRSDGRLAYTERHTQWHQDGVLKRTMTRYFGPRGEPIATLVSRFGTLRHAPSYRYTDRRRDSFSESAEVLDGRLMLMAKEQRKTIDYPKGEPLVLGQGLHHFVRDNFDRLRAGQRLTIRFAIPSRFDTYRFRVERHGIPTGGMLRLRVAIDNWFLRLLAPKIEVEYDLRSRRLSRYRGVSNLQTATGEQQQVVIRYSYGTTEPSQQGRAP